VVRTRLFGFTKGTFTRGIRFAFRKAYARRYNIIDLARIVITNIRDKQTQGRRALAVSAVEFDVQVSTDTAAEADALKAMVKGSDATEASAVLADFKTDLSAVAASGQFADVPTDFVAPPQLSVATDQAVASLETGAPTPAPTSGAGGTSSPFVLYGGWIIATVASLGALALFVLWHRNRTFHAAYPNAGRPPASAPGLEMADMSLSEVYPNAKAGGNGAGDETSVI